MNVIKFKRDTSFRNDLFTPESFAHPAKMDSQLLIWIVEKYTKPGETILDPMFGSGTTMLACILGRNVIGVELEEKFIKMAKANWEKVRQRPQLGCQMGEATILQGDARNLSGLLADKCIFSPPFASNTYGGESQWLKEHQDEISRNSPLRHGAHQNENKHHDNLIIPDNPSNVGNLPYSNIDSIITSPPYADMSMGGGLNTKPPREGHNDQSGRNEGAPSQRGAGGYADSIITSPPYANALTGESGIDWTKATRGKAEGNKPRDRTKEKAWDAAYWNNEIGFRYSREDKNIGNLPYGSIDSVITSPPYEASLNDKRTSDDRMSQLERNVNPENTGRETKRVMKKGFSPHEMNVMGYSVDSIVTSPPYEGIEIMGNRQVVRSERIGTAHEHKADTYNKESSNIGNLKSTSYLEAMAIVYSECYKVLKPGGLMILIVKSFIRDQKLIDLAADTMRLCANVGFTYQERWYRELPSQSFWRIIYRKKYPDAPELKYEDVLVFSKEQFHYDDNLPENP